ncbi:Putative SET domain-containing protein [Septoria linicola]|uniref:SET domain-containing protein n=1 Tax=Septoria linicola TaxID=215465 RepID=A0A9Q9AJD6_9PEZI|nr:putative SET domain-containing protein [Septoria linicola]USW47001.1 Putative SET domain-containing protein [Septoria linicola]
MSPPTSPLWLVQHIANAGRGVVASQLLTEGAVVHDSGPPAVHVLFKQYGKETCAQCFLWDRGRSLPVRENELGKVFCSSTCQLKWVEEHGEVGVAAWRALIVFVRAKGKSSSTDELMADGAKPTTEAIGRAWQTVSEEAELLRKSRFEASMSKQERRTLQAIQRKLTLAKDPDMLSYFLCGVLYDYTTTPEQRQDILDLAMDDMPYKTQQHLDDRCRAFLQLTSLLPPELLPHLTPEMCLNLERADVHNAFGLRGGGEDAEEYMGYGLYPSASYFNHSCDANVHKKRVGRSWEFRAVKDIMPGEECCITYLGGDEKDLDLAGRRKRLEDVWGFVCQCARCKLEATSLINIE